MKQVTAAVLPATILAALLAACANTPPTNQAAALEGGYIAAVSAELAYANTPGANPKLLAEIESYRAEAYAVIEPVVKAAEAGQPVATAELAGASSALAVLDAELVSHNLMKGTQS